MFIVVTHAMGHWEERKFREAPEALQHAVDRMHFYGSAANIEVANEDGVVFNNADIHRTFEVVRPRR